jgi:hypothetical protein
VCFSALLAWWCAEAHPTAEKVGMQKLITIYLDNFAYIKGKWSVASLADKHGLVEEHLEALLMQGWTI